MANRVRGIAKSVLERALSGRLGRLGRGRLRGRLLVLAYHNVVPTDAPRSGDGPLHLPFDTFRRQLDGIPRDYVVLSLLDAVGRGPDGPPAVVFTFDDAYVSSLQLGLPELA
ncbi:MAG TPA: hypothetical protein VFU23_07545, partial [Gemmatimonadales bacterium]|nr:hypothetical protein [Gemmatimonadales bacterium]